MGDADERPKKIEWIEIFAYAAGLDCTPDQRIDGSADLTAGTLIQLRRTSYQSIQCRCDDLFFSDMVYEQPHPGPQSFERGHGLSETCRCRRQFLHLSPVDRLDECVTRRKVAIERPGSDASLSGDVVQAGVCAEAGKRFFRNFQNALAIPLRIRARLPRRSM